MTIRPAALPIDAPTEPTGSGFMLLRLVVTPAALAHFVLLTACGVSPQLVDLQELLPRTLPVDGRDHRLIDWSATASANERFEGDYFFYRCPPGGSAGVVWGSDSYSSDSSICTAAVHAGVATFREGGNVGIQMLAGRSSYEGTSRNGVSTREYGSWPGTYVFINLSGRTLTHVTGGAGRSESRQVDWGTTAQELLGAVNQDFTVRCPPGGRLSSVWGTDIYTDDSSICSAAVHAGRVSIQNGGEVTLRIQPGRESYAGTTRNGVGTGQYGRWDGSFIFP